MKRIKQLCDAYRFKGFRPLKTIKGFFGDPVARVISLQRREKNGLWRLWKDFTSFLRPKNTAGSRQALWGFTDLLGGGTATGGLSQLWGREKRKPVMAWEKWFLYQAICLLRRKEVPEHNDPRSGQGSTPQLADRQSHGNGLHAGEAPEGRQA